MCLMFRKDPAFLLLTETNLDLARQLREAEKEIVEKDRIIAIQKTALERPGFAVFGSGQLEVLIDVLAERLAEKLVVKLDSDNLRVN